MRAKFTWAMRILLRCPINERHINTVFQNYALFPHLNVYENIAFSQRIKKVPKDVIEQKVQKVIKIVTFRKTFI